MKRNLCLLMVATGLFSLTANVTPAVADVTEVVLQPGETQVFDLAPNITIWDPNFWIHFQTSAHVHIRQHLHARGHWTREELEWFHFHAEYILPGPDSRVQIENIGPESVEFDSVMNTVCIGGGANDGEPCMTDGDCPDGTCSAALCRDGGNDGNPCPNGDVDCPDGTCDVNSVFLEPAGTCDNSKVGQGVCTGGTNAFGFCETDADCPGDSITTPMVGVLDSSVPPECPECPPRIVKFWHWDWERSVTTTWLKLWYWSITDFHFAIDEWWHMDTEGIATGVDGEFTGDYSIEITNNGTEAITFECQSNMLVINPHDVWDFVWSAESVNWSEGIWTKDGVPIGKTFPGGIHTGGGTWPRDASSHKTLPDWPNDWHWYADFGNARCSYWFFWGLGSETPEIVGPIFAALDAGQPVSDFSVSVDLAADTYSVVDERTATQGEVLLGPLPWSEFPGNLPADWVLTGDVRRNFEHPGPRICAGGANGGESCLSDINCPDSTCSVMVPAVSDWGLVAMTLLVLTAATVVLLRRRAVLEGGDLSA